MDPRHGDKTFIGGSRLGDTRGMVGGRLSGREGKAGSTRTVYDVPSFSGREGAKWGTRWLAREAACRRRGRSGGWDCGSPGVGASSGNGMRGRDLAGWRHGGVGGRSPDSAAVLIPWRPIAAGPEWGSSRCSRSVEKSRDGGTSRARLRGRLEVAKAFV